MTDNATPDDPQAPNVSHQLPEMDSYSITATRVFEVDISDQQLAGLMQQTGADTPEEAIEQTFMQRETDNVEPEQKLLGVNVQADGPSND